MRPVNADAAKTKSTILAEASSLFAQSGPDAVSIRKIAKASGVSLAMVHHYFGSKNELYDACVDSMYGELTTMGAELFQALFEEGATDDLVERSVRTAFRFARSHQIAMRLLLRTVVASGGLDQTRREQVQLPFMEQISHGLATIIARPPNTVRLLVQSVIILISRYAVSSQTELEFFTNRKGKEAVHAVEEHLVETARALLGVQNA